MYFKWEFARVRHIHNVHNVGASARSDETKILCHNSLDLMYFVKTFRQCDWLLILTNVKHLPLNIFCCVGFIQSYYNKENFVLWRAGFLRNGWIEKSAKSKNTSFKPSSWFWISVIDVF